jgi:hypothetical protein
MAKKLSPMLITEVVTKHYVPVWFKKNFAFMGEEFKRLRGRSKQKFNRCFGCNLPFKIGKPPEVGEAMHLIGFKGLGNNMVCTDCLNKLFGEKAELEHWSAENGETLKPSL